MGLFGTVVFTLISAVSFAVVFFTTLRLAENLSTQFPAGVPASEAYKDEDFWYPLFVDFNLLLVFVLQHSFMASGWWKEKLYNLGLLTIQRSIYVLATSLCLLLLMQRWLPLPVTPLWVFDTWSGERPFSYLFFLLVHVLMWILVYAAALTMDFLELVGVKQVYYYSQDLDHPIVYKSQETQRIYRHMRHPGALCFCIILWVHPVMTLGRFLLALTWTLYLFYGHSVQEHDYVYMETQVERKKVATNVTHSWHLVE